MNILNKEGLQHLINKILASTVAKANALSNTSAVGSATRPVYFDKNGKPIAGTYTLGAACAKGVSTSVSAGDTNLVTSDAVSSAIETSTNYEEGTWTPKIKKTYGDSYSASAFAMGKYKKYGNIVHIRGRVELQTSLSSVTSLYIGGIPFDSSSAFVGGPTSQGMFNSGGVIVGGKFGKYSSEGLGCIRVDLAASQSVSVVQIDLIYWIA